MEEFVFVLLGFGVIAVSFFSLRDWGGWKDIAFPGNSAGAP